MFLLLLVFWGFFGLFWGGWSPRVSLESLVVDCGTGKMIIPVRCFTCGKVIGNKYENYMTMLAQEGATEGYVFVVFFNEKAN